MRVKMLMWLEADVLEHVVCSTLTAGSTLLCCRALIRLLRACSVLDAAVLMDLVVLVKTQAKFINYNLLDFLIDHRIPRLVYLCFVYLRSYTFVFVYL
mgnify:CR=1 FL=1